jgi:hypothetical protein
VVYRGYSDGREEYIVKKYIEKRWVATSRVPETPPRKVYLKPESWVIENVHLGHRFSPFRIDPMSLRPKTGFPHDRKQSLSKRGNQKVGSVFAIHSIEKDTERHKSRNGSVPRLQSAPGEGSPRMPVHPVGVIDLLDFHDEFDSADNIVLDMDHELKLVQDRAMVLDSNKVLVGDNDGNSDVVSVSTSTAPSSAEFGNEEFDSIVFVCDVGVQTEWHYC